MEQTRSEEALNAFAECWGRREYFAAHEVLESFWVERGRPRGGWIQAGILAAAAMEHGARGNNRGALRVLARAAAMLAEGAREAPAPPLIADALFSARTELGS